MKLWVIFDHLQYITWDNIYYTYLILCHFTFLHKKKKLLYSRGSRHFQISQGWSGRRRGRRLVKSDTLFSSTLFSSRHLIPNAWWRENGEQGCQTAHPTANFLFLGGGRGVSCHNLSGIIFLMLVYQQRMLKTSLRSGKVLWHLATLFEAGGRENTGVPPLKLAVKLGWMGGRKEHLPPMFSVSSSSSCRAPECS